MNELRGEKNCEHRNYNMIRYHGPYKDSAGERFYLPRKWHRESREWRECEPSYKFKEGEMNGTDLIRNLHWLGRSNQLMNLINEEEESDYVDGGKHDSNDEDGELTGRGLARRDKKKRATVNYFEDDRNIRRAMPEMDNTLSNWTLHGQNLGVMLKDYKRQYRDMAPGHRRELGHFFNTTSAVLDMIGSMT